MSYMHDAVRLNQLARGLLPVEQGVAWLRSLNESEQRMLLHLLEGMVAQAHPRQEEVDEAITRAGLKPTLTPSVLLRKSLKNLSKLRNLPTNEREKSFRLLVALLGGADRRRRETDCADGCQHWWHRDLSDEGVVRELMDGPPM